MKLTLACLISTLLVPPGPAAPIDAMAAIANALRSHDVVAIPDAHGNATIHAFNLSLVRDPRVQAAVDDIVVEFASARYQDTLDRFERGEEVPDTALRQIWQNTTSAGAAADLPIYEEFLRAVRAVNASPAAKHKIRVIAGDPPIDWENVHTPADYEKWIGMRETFPADLIQKEAVAKHRHALLIYGQMHFQRQNILTNYDMSSDMAQSIVSLLERGHAAKVFTVWGAGVDKLQADAASWPVPSIAIVRGTVLGATDFTAYTSPRSRFAIVDGKPQPLPADQWRKLPAEEQLDAVVYLGPLSTTDIHISRALCDDPAYKTMRLARMAFLGPPGQPDVDRLKQYCGWK